MKNLQLEHSIDEHLKPIKDSDGVLTSLEISTDKIRVNDLEVMGTTTGIDYNAGTILSYRVIGLNETEASYNLTTSYVVPTDEFGITFIAQTGGNVEYRIENIWVDYGGSSAGDFYVGLSTANATTGYSALESYHEKNFGDNEGRYAQNVSSISWTLTGLTAGDSYTYYVGFKSSSTSGTPHLSWGGDATGEAPNIVIKAISLPSSIST